MPDRALDLRLFRYAMTAAEHGSFRRAAAELNIQQSTVSKGIRNLEDRLGAQLFERGHAGIRPTPAGDRFIEEASLGFDHLKRAMQRARALYRGEQGDLTIGISVPFVLLAKILERFRCDFEGVSVEMVESTCRACCTLVEQRKVDVAFVAKAPSVGASWSQHLRDERLIVVLPKAHRLASARGLMLEELRSERLILSTGGLGPEIGDHITHRMVKRGIEPDIQFHRVGQCNLIDMVAQGFGVTIIVGSLPDAAPDGVVLIPLADKNAVSLHAVWMESNPNPALTGLLNIMRRLGEHSAAS